MIGFYNPSVILTYTGFVFAVISLTKAANGQIQWALLFLMICGLCDMFDGTVARFVKRSEDEKQFGIQIDSLCDLVCFGVLPAFICFFAAKADAFRIISMAIYILAAIIRLGYFNVMAAKSPVEIYRGLPVTSAAGFFPLFLVLFNLLKLNLAISMNIFMLVMAICFVADFPLKKPKKVQKVIILIAGIAVLILLITCGGDLNVNLQ